MTTVATVRSFAASLTRPLVHSPLALGLVIFVLALAPRLLDLGVFVGPDEFTWDNRSANFARALVSGNLAETYQDGHPGVTLMWVETLGAWFRYGYHYLIGQPVNWEALIGPEDSMAMLSSKRQILASFNALLVVLSVWGVYRLFGSSVAWLTGFLLAFDPFLLTESRALRSEGIMTGFSMLALLALLLYLRERRLGYSALAGALTSLAILSKVSAVALLPVAGLMIGGKALLDSTRPITKRWPAAIIALLVFGGTSLLTAFVVWPALWVGPVEVIQKMYEYVNVRVMEGNVGGKSFFLDQELGGEELGPLFFPVVLVYRTGPVLWLGLLLLIVAVWRLGREALRRQRDRAATKLHGDKINNSSPLSFIALGTILLYLMVYLALISYSTLKYDRFIIPMLPPLNLLAALGFVITWQRLILISPTLTGSLEGAFGRRAATLRGTDGRQYPHTLTGTGRPMSPSSNLASWLAVLLVLIGQMALALPHRPYYYTYWNPLLGGLKQAAQVLPVGVGEGLDQVATYLNTLPNVEKIKLALANSQKIEPIFKGQTIALDNQDGRWVQSDYTLIYISQLQRGKHDPNILNYLRRQAPVFTVTFDGMEYAWLYPAPAAQYYGGGHKLEGRGTLFGYDLCLPSSACKRGAEGEVGIAAGDTLAMTLYWRNEGQLETDRFFVRLTDLDGYVWAEAIAHPRPGFEEANRQRESILESEAELVLPIGMPPGDYFLKPGFRTTSGEIIGYFELPDNTKPIQVTTAKAYPPLRTYEPPHPVQLSANDDLVLLGYNLEPEEAAPGSALWVTLYWQALTAVTHDYVILLRLLDDQEQEVAYWLGRPVRSGYPTTDWQARQIVQDPWRLTLPAETAPGIYELEVALFDAASETEVSRQGLGPITIAPN